MLIACGVEELTVGGVQLTCLKLLCCLLKEGWLLADCELRLAAVASDVLKDANSGALFLAVFRQKLHKWRSPGWPEFDVHVP